uniref:Uncharacterized protein n=1 Tax=Noctiluca scintillans TaxID=2966 RepID=A0A7S1F372_NOCSC
MSGSLRPRLGMLARQFLSPTRQVATRQAAFSSLRARPDIQPATSISKLWMRPLATSTPWQRVLAEREVTAHGTRVLDSPVVSAPKLEVEKLRKDGLVFEIGITYTVMHYQTIGIAFMRGTFQSFRPLLILFIFGQILKSVFFILGAPMWFSFYSIWMFEVVYGLAQCIISFIFISFFYNNLSFARIRPSVTQLLRQQREKLSRAARMLL